MTLGFYFDAESCIGCRTCVVACKDAHDLPVGINHRVVRTFCTGSGVSPRMYHLSVANAGCDSCAKWLAEGEARACVAACPMRALEYGDIDELRAAHAGESLSAAVATMKDGAPSALAAGAPPMIIRIKECMLDDDFDEVLI